MKRTILGLGAASLLALGLATQAAPAATNCSAGLANAATLEQATDLSAAKKKKKKRSAKAAGGGSKAGTGGGAGGEAGGGAASERQQGTPRGNPATPVR